MDSATPLESRTRARGVAGLRPGLWATTGALVGLYVLVLGTLSVRRVVSGHGALLDLGIFDQVAWNTAHGQLYWDTIDPVARHSFLGQHVSLTLVLTGVLYRVFPWGGPLRLVVVQTLCLASAAVPLAWLARRVLGAAIAPWIAAAYLLAPALSYVNLFDFHEVVLAVPALALACAFLEARRWTPMVLCLLFVLWCKEDMTLVVASFGAYLVIAERGRARLLGVGLLLVGATWAIAVLGVIVPYYRGTPYVFGARYAGGLLHRSGPGGVDLTYLAGWWTWSKGMYLLALLGPWLGLPLLAGRRTLLCLAPLATSLLSTYAAQADYHNQYAAPFLPLGMACTIWALGAARRRGLGWVGHPRATRGAVGAIVLAAAYSAWALGPLPGARAFTPSVYRSSGWLAQAAPLLAQIKATDSVATTDRFGAYLAERRWLWHVPRDAGKAQWVLVMVGDSGMYDYHAQVIAALWRDHRYTMTARRGPILLFQRRGGSKRAVARRQPRDGRAVYDRRVSDARPARRVL